MTYISFLRGVNMAGHNSIKMAELLSLYREMGYADSETYIQSGNVIFNAINKSNPSVIASGIEKAILKRFSFEIPVAIRTAVEISSLQSINPYIAEEHFDPAKMFVIFLMDEPSEEQIQKVSGIDYPPDRFKIINREIFIYCPNGFGSTKLYTNFFEKKMGVTGTARNWKTVSTILNLAAKHL
jgi:uncharacterized protein (DUF1697 family)